MPGKLPPIEVGYAVFLADGAAAFGAVRDLMPGGEPVLRVNIEGAGDVKIPLDAIAKVVEKRVVVPWERLDDSVRQAILHTRDAEDFPPAGDEVDLVPASAASEDEDDRSVSTRRVVSPPDELPGRDRGSRLFLPHHGPGRKRR